MERLQGIITDITYQNEDSGFVVAQLQTAQSEKHTCIGIMPTITRGESVSIGGTWECHRRYGRQFNVTHYEIIRPTTREGIVQLLGSGLIDNIGKVRAQLIIDAFGLETLDILDATPERLLEIPGIGKKMFGKIKDAWQRQKNIRELMLFLQEFGVSVNLCAKIYNVMDPKQRKKYHKILIVLLMTFGVSDL